MAISLSGAFRGHESKTGREGPCFLVSWRRAASALAVSPEIPQDLRNTPEGRINISFPASCVSLRSIRCLNIFAEGGGYSGGYRQGATYGGETAVLTELKIKHAGLGMHSDGEGLYLQVSQGVGSAGLSKSWIYRFQLKGRRREM